MPRNKTFQLRPKADNDLENIYEYSYQEFGSARAENYINDLDDAFHTLADKPSLGNDYGPRPKPDLQTWNCQRRWQPLRRITSIHSKIGRVSFSSR